MHDVKKGTEGLYIGWYQARNGFQLKSGGVLLLGAHPAQPDRQVRCA